MTQKIQLLASQSRGRACGGMCDLPAHTLHPDSVRSYLKRQVQVEPSV